MRSIDRSGGKALLLTRDYFDAGIVDVAALGVAAAAWAAWRVRAPFAPGERSLPALLAGLGCLAGAALLAWIVSAEPMGALAAFLVSLLVVVELRRLVPQLTMAGAIETALLPLSLAMGLPWSLMLLRELGAGPVVLIGATGLALLSLPFAALAFAAGLARNAILTHDRWARPHRALRPRREGRRPKVSFHLPCYAEPPELVIATIDRLAAMDYPLFEILVCDNNTRDERLWRPVEAHCAALAARLGPGRSVRFFHVAPLAGAKAGALNFLLGEMARDAELIAVIDADYQARPDFLARLVGFFDDARVGYLQTPHDYRGWQGDPYLRKCYWEYMPSNKLELPGLAEYGASYTIGTMCLLRTAALRAAGGWAEWCLTEDSEVSVRLRAIGYEGVYLAETFGRGLIPDRFEDYKKQRFRWTAGPVQQLRRHWRLYLPREWSPRSGLHGWSRLLEAQRGIAPLAEAAGVVVGVGLALGAAWASASGLLPPVALPPEAWVAIGLGALGVAVRRWHRYRLAGCDRLIEMIEGELARAALGAVQMLAAVAGLSSRELSWRRTPKFAEAGSGRRALQAAPIETAAGLALAGLAAWPLSLALLLGSDGLLLAAIGLVGLAARFLAAPAMAWIDCRRSPIAAPAPIRAIATDRLREA